MKWISARPLEGFSSLHEGLLWDSCGLRIGRFSSVISFNAETALPRESVPAVTIHYHPIDQPMSVPRVDFCIDQLTQWELDLTPFKSFNDYLNQLNHKQRYNYSRTEKSFANCGCRVSLIEGDWSEYAERAYELYHNVAAKYMQIYDLDFFRTIAKLPSYKLICAWFGPKLIGTVVTIEEASTIHSMGCGLDYLNSKKSFTYSKLHYEFIRHAIEAGKFKVANTGVTADQAKKTLGLSPKAAVIEISVQNAFFGAILRLAQLFLKVSINTNNDVCVKMRWPSFAAKSKGH